MRNLSFVWVSHALSAGSHTVKWKFSKYAAANPDWNVFWAKTQVVRFRGGLVPWERDGVQVLDTPRAINIVGGTMSLADDGSGKLNVELPTAVTALGQRVPMFQDAPATTQTISSGTFADIPGSALPEQQFVVSVEGLYDLSVLLHAVSSQTVDQLDVVQYQLIFDEGGFNGFVEQIVGAAVGEDLEWRLVVRNTGSGANGAASIYKTVSAQVALEVGTHKVKIQAKTTLNAPRVSDSEYFKIVGTLVTGSGVGGTILDSKLVLYKTISGVFSPSPSYTDVPELTLNFTASEGEQVLIKLCGNAFMPSAGLANTHVRVLLDGTTDLWPGLFALDYLVGQFYRGSLSLEVFTDPLSAGDHTVTFHMAKWDVGNVNWQLQRGLSYAVQFRGGLVPIRADGVTKVDKPQAINFIGAEVVNQGGVADVSLPQAVTVPGDSVEMLSVLTSADRTTTSATFVDVHAEFSSSFSIEAAGLYDLALDLGGYYAATSWAGAIFRLVFDVGTGEEQIVGADSFTWGGVADISGGISIRVFRTITSRVTLTAGSHTVKLQWKRAAGTGTLTFQGGYSAARLTGTLVTGSGAGGTLLGSASLASNQTVSSTANPPTATIPTMGSVVINCTPGEIIRLSCVGNGAMGGAASATLARFAVDGTPLFSGARWNWSVNAGYSFQIEFEESFVATATQHTITLLMSCLTTSCTVYAGLKISAWQSRGGLVPVRQDGTTVVDKPVAFDFVGAQVTNVGGVAKINLLGVTGTIESTPYFADRAGGVVAPSFNSGGSFSVGSRFGLNQTGLKIAGAYFETQKAGAHTIRIKLWEQGNATALASVDVAVSGPGFYEGRFTTPYEIPDANVPDKNYYISMWDVTGVGWTEWASSPYYAMSYVHRFHTVWTRSLNYAVGDANISASESGTQSYPIDPIIVAPGDPAGFVQPENVPQLSYSSASVVQAVAAPGASSELRVLLNDGQRYKATSPLSVDITASGEGGLDTGSEAADTWYNVFAVPSATAGQFALVLSTALSSVGPTGFAAWKHLGWIRNNGSSNIVSFYQVGSRFYREAIVRPLILGSGGPDGSPVTLDLSAYVPPSASEAMIKAYAYNGSTASVDLSIYVDGAASRYNWIYPNIAHLDSSDFLVPTPTSPKQIQYQRNAGTIETTIIDTMGWIDGELRGEASQTQAQYLPDTKSPKGTWATSTTVNFAARPGQPSTMRLTLQDAKQRTATGTLAWAIANGVADLGYDEAASQGNSKWLYFYAVPSSGDDDVLTVRASDNPPTAGPTGYSNWKLIWSTYIDGSGNLRKVYQRGDWFYNSNRSEVYLSLGAGSDGSPVTPSNMALWCPATAGEVQSHVAGSTAALQLFIDGESDYFDWSYNGTNYDSVTTRIPMPTVAKQVQYQRTSGFVGGLITCLGWIDEWIDP